MKNIGFIGLGVMGFPMAGHLANAGHRLQVFNRSPAKAKRWSERYPGTLASSPANAAQGADMVIICVGNDEDLRDVMLNNPDAVLPRLSPGTVVVDHSSTTVEVALEIAHHCQQRQSHFIDAPVSGGQAGAEAGQLTIMAGGDENILQRVSPILEVYSKQLQLMGDVGSGQKTKMVNQICVAGLLQALAEGVHFAQQANLDVEKVLSVISQGAAQSWQMDNRGTSMQQSRYDFGFAVDWMRKDLANCLAEARNNGSQLPVTALVDQFYGEVQNLSLEGVQGGKLDTSSLLLRLKNANKCSG